MHSFFAQSQPNRYVQLASQDSVCNMHSSSKACITYPGTDCAQGVCVKAALIDCTYSCYTEAISLKMHDAAADQASSHQRNCDMEDLPEQFSLSSRLMSYRLWRALQFGTLGVLCMSIYFRSGQRRQPLGRACTCENTWRTGTRLSPLSSTPITPVGGCDVPYPLWSFTGVQP